MKLAELINEVKETKKDIIDPTDVEIEVITKLVNLTVDNAPKVFNSTKAINYCKIEKNGKNRILMLGEDKDNLSNVIEYNPTLKSMIITTSDVIFGSAIAAQAIARLLSALVKQPELQLAENDEKPIITEIKVSGTKITIKHKGKVIKLVIGSVYELFVMDKSTRPIKVLVKDDISPLVSAFGITQVEEKDGDITHVIGNDFKISDDDEIPNVLYNLFQDADNAEDVYDWIKDLPLGDTVQDIHGNGFVVSDIADHIEAEYEDYAGFDKGR